MEVDLIRGQLIGERQASWSNCNYYGNYTKASWLYIQLFQIFPFNFPVLSIFYNSIFPFPSRYIVISNTCPFHEVFANCNYVMQTIARQSDLTIKVEVKVKLSLNCHGIIADSDSALRWYELFTTFRSRHYFPDCSVNTAIFPFREILRYASWFNNDGVEVFLSRDHCALFAERKANPRLWNCVLDAPSSYLHLPFLFTIG